jgi:hypothetical protein
MSVPDYVYQAGSPSLAQDVRRALSERGFAVVRDLFSSEMMADLNERVDRMSRQPAIAGALGYAKVDHPKRLMSPYAIGGPAVDMILDERIITLVEAHMGSECVLAETNVKIDEPVGYTYFPMHADFSEGWTKEKDGFGLTAEHLKDPIGIGGAIYLHDTTEGAFSYCEGTHVLMAPRGPDLDKYPDDERRDILARYVRIEGKTGDFVLFDDRGFHGPDQPSFSRRTVILVDYYRVATFGRKLVSPVAVWSTDLGRLSPKQLRVMGVGAGFMVPPERYMLTRFRRSRMYDVTKFLIENAYLWSHMKSKVRERLTASPRPRNGKVRNG